ncbi:MAG: toll/interleukin-1 receptor domain-containing protein [Terracidiphilus sp.]|nr:toll/interleukin-1 receptor domain-containing protein [Terracidiphilus sp.]
MAHDVFISHSAKDKVTADAVCAMLESNGIRCWIAPRDVIPSMEWGEAIIDAIEQCRIMVLVFTANANASPQIRREVERAVNRGVAILPLRMEDVLPGKSLEYFIGNVHWLDALTPPVEAHLKNLAGTIRILLARNEQGAPTTLPQEERPAARGGHHTVETTPGNAGVRETAPAPRPFWSTQSWTWAGGAVAALLVAVFVGVHFTSGPAPAGSPPPQSNPGTIVPGGIIPAAPASSPPPVPHNPGSLRDTMGAIQKELGSIGTVSFTRFVQNQTGSGALQKAFVEQFSNVAADPGQCRVSYHWKMWQNGVVTLDKDAWFLLPSVTSVVVEPESQLLTEGNVAQGHPELVVTSTTPQVTAVVVRRPSVYNAFPFTNIDAAKRFSSDVKQAVKLCGGHSAD